MNILFIIDNLGSGGAERQCVALATGLKKKSHEINILGYAKGDHFLNEVNDQGIEYYLIEENISIRRILKFRRKIREIKPDAIIAFLQTSSLLAVFASLPVKSWELIVSERNNISYNFSFKTSIIMQLYRFADSVTTNSKSSTNAVMKKAPFLKKKIHTIYNGLNLERFTPMEVYKYKKRKVIVVISSHQEHKNAKNLVFALKRLRDRKFDPLPIIYWYGSDLSYTTGKPCETYINTKNLIESNSLQNTFILKYPAVDIENIYRASDALLLCSFWEGLPNAVCEAMACGLPILMSNISDYITLTEGNGIFFNPHSASSIADAINRFCRLDKKEIMQMRLTSRRKAEKLFSIDKMVDSYNKLIES